MVRTLAANTVEVTGVRREFSHWLQQHFCLTERDAVIWCWRSTKP